ncbi:hypothetical protein HMPREF1624_08524 [Sporothrix schenckii ATCC 58251]|uniref:Uncharacterized protein n=1 Tax=Sporothrix schenckii (strain ATCC 58251 / de Perez 2211183) TaxID=1391915 RepID=U7PKI4_SPOS1|nr:hypothetical protein HMPREF1624_08524 [Sporothrix schenckii ATCC 58251]
MDVAAQEINKLVQRILPDRPYHLSVSATGRYPVPPGLWPNTSPLQYTTFVSEADRGILLTRPYFDIQLETEDDPNNTKNKRGKATSSTSTALPGGSPAGAGNKGETKKPTQICAKAKELWPPMLIGSICPRNRNTMATENNIHLQNLQGVLAAPAQLTAESA